MMRAPVFATAALVAAFFMPGAGQAQRTPMFQSGTMVPGDLSKFVTNGMASTVGSLTGDALGVGVNPFAIYDRGGIGLYLHNAPTDGPHTWLGLGHDAAGNALISVQGANGAAAPALNCDINGSVVPCITPLDLPWPILKGGTGATTAAQARANLGIPANSGPALGQRRFIIVGDSRYRRSSDAAGSLNPGWYAGGPWTWFRAMATGRAQIYLTDNFAKGGTTIAQAVTDPTMIKAALASSRAGDVLVFNSGTNTFVASNVPFGQSVIDDMNAIFDMCESSGVVLVVVTPAARDTWANEEQYNSFIAYRRWLMEWGRISGVKIIDLFGASSDPNAVSPSYSRAWWTVDGLHQSILGSIREAQLYMRELEEYMPPEQASPTIAYRLDIAPGTVAYPNPYGGLIDGGMMPGTGGTISPTCAICSGDVAASWTVSYSGTSTLTGSVALSKITLPDGSAAQRLNFANISGGTNREPFSVSRSQGNAAQRWKAGDRIEGQVAMSIRGTPRSVNYELVYNRGDGQLTLTDAQKNLPDPGNVVVLNAPFNSGATWTLTVVPGAGAPGACNGGVGIAFPYTLSPGDSTSQIAAAWAAAINANATLSACGYSAVAAAVPPNPGTAVAIHSPYRENQSVTFASTNGGSISPIGGPGQYGNMPGDPVISGVWNTDRMTLPAETAVGASTLRESIIIWVDASDPTGVRGNATVDISRVTSMVVPGQAYP